ncbi:hypothetical protein [Aquimarina megaterium]|uniref:hypothetical protein n=1 Tax=Aquimarina megaterium TaxID=1443666 RepID=UPI0009422923|nr:hypothetical protein [Aquimarina megaterium]
MSKKQIIPFPLPEYLATYFGNKLNTKTHLLTNGSLVKPFHVDMSSSFGRFVCTKLSKANKPTVLEKGMTFFIEVSLTAGSNFAEVVEGRYALMEFTDQAINEITLRFKAAFERELLAYVAGAESQHEDTLKSFPSKRKTAETSRVRTKAIKRFCHNNHVLYSDKNLEAWKKRCQRYKTKHKDLIYNAL